jgi:hypothetical protein
VVTKQTTDEIKRYFPEVGIILGGQAFKDRNHLDNIQFDEVLNSLSDLKAFSKKVAS